MGRPPQLRESRPAGWSELQTHPGWGAPPGAREGLRFLHAGPQAPCSSAGRSSSSLRLFRCRRPPGRTRPARPRLMSMGVMLVVGAPAPSTYCVSDVSVRDLA